MKYKMINSKELPISQACNVLEINRSSYYGWQNKQAPDNKDVGLRKVIQEISLEYMGYGYRRVAAELRRRSRIVNRKKVLRIMREEHLICKKKKFKPCTTNSNHGLHLYPNIAKNIMPDGLNQLWVADITYIQISDCYVYLSAIIEIFSRKCIGWDLSRNIDTILTLNALNMAIADRKSIGLNGLVHHSDRGVQYASKEYVKRLNDEGIRISMTETGNPRENAFAESFIKTLKAEEVYLKEYETFEEAHSNIKQFIEAVYNAKRLHSSIGYVPPIEFETEVLNIRYLTVQK